VRPEYGRISGGGARSELWRTIVASVLDLPVESTAAEEGAAYGAALLAGCRAGTFADPRDAVARCVAVRGRTDPDPAWVSAYEDGYRRFRRVYPALRSV
jgi:xylulokinase